VYNGQVNIVMLTELIKRHHTLNDNSLEEDLKTVGFYIPLHLQNVLLHEIGHAIHNLLESQIATAPEGYYIATPAIIKFRKAYEKDCADFNENIIYRMNLYYFLQPAGTGASETFAELWGLHQRNDIPSHEYDIRYLFPNTMKVIEDIDQALKYLFAQREDADQLREQRAQYRANKPVGPHV